MWHRASDRPLVKNGDGEAQGEKEAESQELSLAGPLPPRVPGNVHMRKSSSSPVHWDEEQLGTSQLSQGPAEVRCVQVLGKA